MHNIHTIVIINNSFKLIDKVTNNYSNNNYTNNYSIINPFHYNYSPDAHQDSLKSNMHHN